MTTLTDAQITAAILAVRDDLMSNIDFSVNKAISNLGVNPIEVSEAQYTEIIDGVFE